MSYNTHHHHRETLSTRCKKKQLTSARQALSGKECRWRIPPVLDSASVCPCSQAHLCKVPSLSLSLWGSLCRGFERQYHRLSNISTHLFTLYWRIYRIRDVSRWYALQTDLLTDLLTDWQTDWLTYWLWVVNVSPWHSLIRISMTGRCSVWSDKMTTSSIPSSLLPT